MKEIIIKTQAELDKVKLSFEGKIIIKDTKEYISIKNAYPKAFLYVSGYATIKSVSDDATIESVYGYATIKSVSDDATIKSVYDYAKIKSVYGNATIKYVYGNATIESVSDDATIESVSGYATIKSVSGYATIESVYGNVTIESVSGNATIEYVSGYVTILLMTGLACVCFLYVAKKIVARGMNMIRQIGTEKIDIEMSKSVNFIQVKENIKDTPNWDIYSKLYPVDIENKKAIMYKAVHKIGEEYVSNCDSNFKYEIGKVKTEICSPSTDGSCSSGLHISHKRWALLFGKDWDNLAILEVEVEIKNIVVCSDCDGKVRTSKLKVLREVPKNEWYD